MSTSDTRKFKLLLVGDSGTGKTTFIKRHTTGDFESAYNAMLFPQTHHLLLSTFCFGDIVFDVWDFPGQEQVIFNGLHEGFFVGGQCAIVLFDVNRRITYLSVPRWLRALRRVCPDIPVVVCANKVDVGVQERKVPQHSIDRRGRPNLPYHEISVKENRNLVEPLNDFARQLVGNASLNLYPPELVALYSVELGPLDPPEIPEDEDEL
ncbi:GTP-binding nuclear protein RAN [Roridomyces roridus]|uniref:GTP-binding nuclear protein n=1 Tax=Roridomyces roridus TaxID=1738132 RepID=A0AAD7FPW2_9AGAR|nr:GTP-binding nuclear protein RAN [Roridomyces roridus]